MTNPVDDYLAAQKREREAASGVRPASLQPAPDTTSSPAAASDSPTMQWVRRYDAWGIKLTAANADKTPAWSEWHTPIPPGDFAQYFGGPTPKRPAALLGAQSKGFCDIDIDAEEVRMLAQEPSLDFLTFGTAAFGRAGRPPGHLAARCTEAMTQSDCRGVTYSLPASAKDKLHVPDEHGLMFAEVRGNGQYTVLPNGTDIVWQDMIGREIPSMPWAELVRRAGLLAFAGFCVRQYPPTGVRNDFNLAMHGALLRALRRHYGEDEATLVDHVDRLVLAICRQAGDLGQGPSWENRAATTLSKLKGSQQVTGLRTMLKILGLEEVAPTLRRWLGPDMEAEDCIDPNDWTRTAHKFVDERMPHLRYHNGALLDYRDGAYREYELSAVSAQMRDFLDSQKVMTVDKKGNYKVVPFHPNRNDIAEGIAGIKDVRHVDRDSNQPPCWLPSHDGPTPPPLECIPLRNGILHVPTGELIPPTPNFFTRNALDFNFAHDAECPLWTKTLRDYWPDKADGAPADEVLKLQEILGYKITPDTSLHKIFVYWGVTRSGKGTITYVESQLLGSDNCVSLPVRALSGEFGAEPLIDKLAAYFPETAFSGRDDRVHVTAFIKAVSGEDAVSINRKNKPFWTGKLRTRQTFICQRIPNFADDSNAIGERLEILRFTRSFLGNEDPALKDKLIGELPGILNWAIEGRKRLWANGGRFTATAAGNEDRDTVNRLASPVRAFSMERCVLRPEAFATEEALYKAYREWCASNGVHGDTGKGEFIESLTVVYPGKVSKARRDFTRDPQWRGRDKRPRGLVGIELRDLLASQNEEYVP